MEKMEYYGFRSAIHDFIMQLLHKSLKAEPSKALKKYDEKEFSRNNLVKVLMDNGFIKRKSSIKDSTNSNKKKTTYAVKYTLSTKFYSDYKLFDKKVHELYNKYKKEGKMELNEAKSVFSNEEEMKKQILSNPKDKEVYETRGGINMPLVRREIYNPKVIKNEQKMAKRNVYFTESQMRYIDECLNSINAGDMMLFEDGEGASDGGGIFGGAGDNGRGAYVGNNKAEGGIGSFKDNGDGFFDSAKTESAPKNVTKKQNGNRRNRKKNTRRKN